ncbi:MAG: hypothetical protein HY884_10210 [Deltaproteobacteria bacterium]|nr:hypothetical protein [Deltaproteobacteria bacterium]
MQCLLNCPGVLSLFSLPGSLFYNYFYGNLGDYPHVFALLRVKEFIVYHKLPSRVSTLIVKARAGDYRVVCEYFIAVVWKFSPKCLIIRA